MEDELRKSTCPCNGHALTDRVAPCTSHALAKESSQKQLPGAGRARGGSQLTLALHNGCSAGSLGLPKWEHLLRWRENTAAPNEAYELKGRRRILQTPSALSTERAGSNLFAALFCSRINRSATVMQPHPITACA